MRFGERFFQALSEYSRNNNSFPPMNSNVPALSPNPRVTIGTKWGSDA
jgi:hypothetical protein